MDGGNLFNGDLQVTFIRKVWKNELERRRQENYYYKSNNKYSTYNNSVDVLNFFRVKVAATIASCIAKRFLLQIKYCKTMLFGGNT